MWFDSLLERDPETFRPLIAHPSVRPYLEALLGPQCQLRSLRAHINPGPYLQEWHMDFYGYWRQPKRRLTVRGVGINTTFYFQDNGPDLAHLKFVKGGHLSEPLGLDPKLVRGYGMNENGNVPQEAEIPGNVRREPQHDAACEQSHGAPEKSPK